MRSAILLLALAGQASAAIPTSLDVAPNAKLGMTVAAFTKAVPGTTEEDQGGVRWFTSVGKDANVTFAFRADKLVYAQAEYGPAYVGQHPFTLFIAPSIVALGMPQTWKDVSGGDAVRDGALTDSVAWTDGKTFFAEGRANDQTYVAIMGQAADLSVLTAGKDGVPAADFAHALKLMQEMADIADKDQASCDQMADDLSAFLTAHGDEMKRLQSLRHTKPSPEQMQELQAPMTKMMGPMMKCQGNAKMQELGKKM